MTQRLRSGFSMAFLVETNVDRSCCDCRLHIMIIGLALIEHLINSVCCSNLEGRYLSCSQIIDSIGAIDTL